VDSSNRFAIPKQWLLRHGEVGEIRSKGIEKPEEGELLRKRVGWLICLVKNEVWPLLPPLLEGLTWYEHVVLIYFLSCMDEM
jgi:hypothetical protein